MLGKLQPQFFPQVFGPDGDLPLDADTVRQRFAEMANKIRKETGNDRSPEEVAAGFLAIAVEKMANAIKKISIQRGHNLADYVLCSFGGAGGQHACTIASALGIPQITIHPYAGVLSAYGMGLADLRVLREKAIEEELRPEWIPQMDAEVQQLTQSGRQELLAEGVETHQIEVLPKARVKYAGTDIPLLVDCGGVAEMRSQFEQLHLERYGFVMPEKALVVESLSVESVGRMPPLHQPTATPRRDGNSLEPIANVPVFFQGSWQETPVYRREHLRPGDTIDGPAIVLEAAGTNVIEADWQATASERLDLLLTRALGKTEQRPRASVFSRDIQQEPAEFPTAIDPALVPFKAIDAATSDNSPDPVLLEIFNNVFRAIAEEMGIALQNTSYSVNIKERLDFSCALFDEKGQLVANAPHIPVHLGSMSESVQSLMRAKGHLLQPGDVYLLNNPYNGGTHLPDITVISPIFDAEGISVLFYVASRGHHADIGGTTPGSMPPDSTSVDQEGILLDNFLLVSRGEFREEELLEKLASGPYPARNPAQNLADIQAQIAANKRGAQELQRTIEQFGLSIVQVYMGHVQANAEESVRRAIATLVAQNLPNQSVQHQQEQQSDGAVPTHIFPPYVYPMDGGARIRVQVKLDASTRSAQIDFTGTSPQLPTNFNTPLAVTKAAVLYVFRTLVDDDIPLNAGCLTPLELLIPEGCMLNPHYPAAVVAGNVETSQAIVNALYGALGVMAAGQGTMNNFTFGSDRFQYYETICGGSGAGPTFHGTDAVQTHMTNSRLTDPEVLEWRFPVLLQEFSIRLHSRGQGHFCGGNGVLRKLKFLQPATAGILSGHRLVEPPGLAGGGNGSVGRTRLIRRDGTVEVLRSCDRVEVQPGDIIEIATPGGGGWGPETHTTMPRG